MNKIFKVIWSKSKQCYIVVSEIAKNKTGKKKIVVASILAALAMQSGMITDVMAADPPSARLADAAEAAGTNGVAIGSSARSKSNQSVAIGYFSVAQAPGANPENPATAVGAGANANGAGTVALGLSANATGANTVALGGGSNGGKYKTEATGTRATAISFNAKASGSDSIALGNATVASDEKAIAIGSDSKATNIGTTALGRSSAATGASATALGSLASASGTTATAVGMQASATGNESVAIGQTASATSGRALAVGTNAKATGVSSVAVGSGAGGSGAIGFAGSLNSTAGVVNTNRTINYATTAEGDNAVALGFYANAKNSGVAVGQKALAATGGVAIGKGVLEDTGNNLAGGVVIGQDSATLGPYSLAMGFNAFASGSTSMAVGHTASAVGNYAVAMGRKVSATGTSTAIGHHVTASNGGLAIGSQDNDASNDRTTASAAGSIAIGKNTNSSKADSVAIGTNAQSTLDGAVALGSGSTTATGATNQGSTTINGITYNFAGATGNPNMQVSVGSAGATRQIKNVAAGEVSAISTDAINGSQLYAVASAVKPLKYLSVNSTATGTGSNVDNDGAQGGNSIAIGPSSTVTRQNGIAIGNGAQSLSEDSVVIGRNAKAETKAGAGLTTTSRAIAIGSNSRVAADVTQGIAIGSGNSPDEGAVVTGDQSIAIGGNVKVDGHAAIAIGGDDAKKAAAQTVSYTSTNDVEVTGSLQNAILNLTGYNLSKYKGTEAGHAGVAYGTSALAGNAGVAIGTAADSMTRMNDKGQVVNNKPVTNAVAIGTGARANFDNSVAIGGGSNTDHYATKQVNAVIDGVEVKWSGGENISPGDVVSFGAKGFERQLKNVAPGEVSQTSTDAVNGSQIYSLARKVTNIMNGGSGSVVNVNAAGEPLSKVVTGTGASKVEKYYRTVDVKDDGTLATGAIAQTPASLALVNVAQTDTNKQTQTPRILGNVANGVKDNDAVNVSQLNAAKVKYFSVNSSDAGNVNNNGATGTDAIAIGPSATSNDVGSVALGKDAKANGAFTVALGGGNWQFKGAQANGVGTTALGSNTKTQENINYQTAIGFGATTSAESALALGYNASAAAQNAIALGKGASTAGQDSLAFGVNSQANGGSALAMGSGAQANNNYVISLGYQANNGASNNANSVSIGWAAGMQSNGASNVGVGSGAGRQIVGNNNVSIGNGAGNIANNNMYTSDSIMLGTQARAINGTASKAVSSVIAIGKGASGGADSTIAMGQGATATNQNAIALGTNANASAYNGVALGSYSVANTAGGINGFNPNTSRTDAYAGLAGRALASTTGAIAIGSDSQSRQLTGLAAGTADTDAVNVAQLKSVNLAFKGNAGTGDVNLAAHPLTIQGNDNYITTSANGNTINISGKVQNITVNNGTATATSGMADAKNVAEAINSAVQGNAYKWKLTASGEATPETIAKDDTVDFSGDNNISVSRTGKKITTSLKKDITVDTVKANKSVTTGSGTNQITLDGTTGAVTGRTFSGQSFTSGDNVLSNTTLQIGPSTGGNNVSITRDGLTAKAGTKTAKFGANGIDAGGQQITNVSSGGNVGTNAANITDVKNAVSDVTLKLDTNSKTGNVKLGDGSLKITGANGIRTDLNGTGNSNLVIGLDQNTVNATTKGIALNGDAGSTGLKYLKDGDAVFKVYGDGNLVTTAGSATGVKVSVDSTKVKDLAVEAVTVSKATNISDNPITVTPTAGTNSKDYAIGIDTTKLAAKTNLAYTANGATAKTVSLAKGLNFVNGTNTVATVDSEGKVSFDLNQATKDSINKSATAVGRTITLNADSGTGSSQSLSNGNVSFAVSGATGDYISTTMDGSAVKVSTKRATIDSDANTGKASVTGADGLATAKNVASAINSAVNGLSQNLNISDGTKDSSVALKSQKLTVTGTGAAKATVNNQTITVDVAEGTLTPNTTDGSVTGTTGVAKATEVAVAINNTKTVLGTKIDKNAADIATNKGNIATNTADIATNKGKIATNTANIATNTANIAHTIALADDKGASTTAKSLKDGNVSFNIKGDNKFISTAASGNDVTLTVNEQAIKDAAKNASSFKVKANAHAEEEVKGGDTIAFNNGDNIEISQTGKTFTIGTAKNITVDSVTAGNTVINTSGLTNGTTAITGTGVTTDKVTVGGISIDKTDGINAGGKVISNVASGGTTDSNAANIGDVKQAVANLSQNLNITDGTNNGTIDLKNQKLNVTGANGVTATVNNQTVTVGLDANTVNATTKGIGLTADTGSTGNKYLKDGDVSFAVTGDGNLVSTSATAAGVKVAVDAAKVKDLAVSAVTVSKDAQADNPITVTPTAGTNSKDYAIGIDTTKLAAKTDLTYRANSAADTNAKKVSLSKGLDFVDGGSTVATVDNDGKVSFDLNTATKTQINTNTADIATNKGNITKNAAAIATNAAAIARNITLGADAGTASSQSLSKADVAFNVKGATGDFVSTNMNGNTVEISTTRATINSNATTGEASVTGADGLATAKNVSDAINKAAEAAKAGAAWNITTNSSTTDKTAVKGGDTVDLVNGDNIEITQDGTDKKKIIVATKKDITVDSVTANNKVTVGSGANAITLNGADGSVTGKAFTGTTFTGTSFTAGNTVINTNGLTNGTTAITGTGVTTDTLTVGGVSIDKTDGINAGGKVISNVASGGTTATNAANIGDIQTAVGNQNLKFAGNTNTAAGVVNIKDDTFNIVGDGKYVSTDANGKNLTVKVSEAEVKKSAVAAVTVSTDTTDANNPLTVTPTTSADGTTKDYKVTIDGTKIANKTNLSYKANDGTAKQVSLADGLNFKNGTLTTASIDDAGVVKYDVNTAAITAGTDGTITGPTTDGVATAQNVADAINAAKKASKTEITANTGEAANATKGNVTLTSTTAADGHTIYDVKLNDTVTLGSGTNAITVDGTAAKVTAGVTTVDGVTGTITTGGTNSIKVDGATGTVTGLTNKDWTPGVTKAVTGRAATEDQLQKVADAASSQTWNITADKAGTTGAQTGTKKNATVGKDETVELVAGDNLTINQDERKFTYSLNKDLAGLTSVSVGTGTTETIKLDGATGKITAKNAAIGGVTIDGDNKHVTGLSNTTWNGTATTGRAATEDQLKAVAETAKTTTDAVNLKFAGDTNTSPGVVNLKDDTLGVVGDGKYVSTDANGKNLTVKVSEAEVKKSAVAAVTVSTDTTDANNPISVTPITSADGTTKDYKVTIDGTKIANKTNLSYKANDGTAKQVSLADGLNFKNGTLTTASIDDAGVVKYDVNTATITAGTDGTITGPTTDGVATAQNVADAINAAKKAAKTEITANTGEAANATKGNVTLTSTTAADGHTIYDVKLNDKVTIGSGANAVTIDGTAGKATVGSSVVDGVNNTFTTGGTSPVTLDGATGTITGKTANIGGITVNGTANTIGGLSNTTWNGTATTGRAATEDQLKAVADAAGSQTWEITADKDAATSGAQTGTKKDAKVGKDDKVQLIAGENLTVNQNERDFTYSLNKDLVKMNSATFEATGGKTTVIKGDSIVQTAGTQTNTSTAAGNTVADGAKSTVTTADGTTITNGANSTATTAAGTTVTSANGNTNYAADGIRINTTGKTPVSLTDAGLDNGNNVIKNVASGHVNNDATDNTNAANIADVKKATTTVTANAGEVANATKGNVTLTSTTAADGHTIYDVKLNDKVTFGSGANAVTIDGTAGKATIGSSVVDGVNSTITTGGANAVTMDGAAGTVKTGTVTVTGGTTNDITGLSNTTVTAADFATKGRAATEEQLKAVGEQTWQITADKDATTSGNQTGTKKDAKVGKDDKVQLIAGENLTVNQNERDFTFSLNKDLVKMNSATFEATGGKTTVITGDSITQTDGTKTNRSTAAGNTVADGTKSTETTAAGQVIKDGVKSNKSTVDSNVIDDGNGNVNTSNATSNTITDGTNTSAITAGKAQIGTVGIDGITSKVTTGGANAVTMDGAAGTVKTGTVTVTGGTTNDITGLSNTTVTAADFATKGRAATEEQLKAVGEQTWQITADKDATTSGNQTGTKKDAKVGKDDKVQLIAGENLTVNQNERDFTYSLNKDLVKMNSATFEATGGKTTVITGDSITQTDGTNTNTSTAAGNTVADGTKSTETTAAGQVIKDGAKSNKSTVDSNVIDDGNGNVNTSNATSNTITDGTNTSAITAGKAQIGTVGIDGITSKVTTGGANAVALDGAAGTIKTGTVTVTGGTTNDITGLSNTTVTSADFATKGRAATEEQLKAVGEQTWQITADKDATTSGNQTGTKKDAKVGKDDKVQLIAGENLTVNQNERDFTYSLNKDLVKMNSATFLGTGINTTVITGDSITQTAGTQTNTSTAAGNTVADGTKSTETTAAGQVIKDGAKTNTSTVDENTLVDGAKSNKTTVDSNVINDGNGNVNTSNATSNTITDGTNTSAITAGKATIGSSVVDGVNNTITTGGANAVALDGAAGTVKTGTVTVTGGTTNDITGLSNTTVTAADFATKGRAATEEQLKAVGEQTWQITADKDATTSGNQTGTKKDAKVGKDDKVQLIAGENLTVNQNERDFTFSLNKDLVKMNSATFEATGGKTTVITGDSITQTDGTKTNTSTAAGNTVADGTKSTETTAAGQVIKDGAKTNTSTVDENTLVDGAKSNKTTVDSNVIDDGNGNVNTSNATSNTITDGTNTSAITAGKAQIGTVSIDGITSKVTTGGANAVALDGAAGTVKTGTVTVTGGTTNDITGLSNTTVNSADFATKGRAATEEQLKQVGEQTWQITADKDATTSGNQTGTKKDAKVGKDDKVQLIAGENLTVNQNERDFTYSLNKDLVKMNSATFEATGAKTTVITGNSITQTDGTKTNTSTAAGNTVTDGTKSTETTAAGQVIKDGAKSNKSTVDSNVIDDGYGNVNTSNATSNTIANGTDSTATTAAGTTVTNANGNTKYAAEGVRINTTGKNPVSLTDAGLDNGNNVIKNVASGHVNNNDTDNTNAANIADVKKATTTVTANNGEAANATTGNVTLTSTTAADGHTIYDVKLNDKVTLGTGSNAVTIDGTAGKATIGSSVVDGVNSTITTGGTNAVALDGAAGTVKTGTVTVTGGTTNDITGLSNTTVTAADFATKGRAATEEQLKAVGEQTWQITADKDAATSGNQTGTKKDAKVGKDDKVQLIAGENLTVNQNERDFTYSLNKDLVKMNSATFEATGGKTTVITGDSISQTDGTKTNTSTATGNTVADGTKSTETTAAGQVIKDGAKTNTSTVDENTLVDGAKSNKTTVDSNVIDDGNGNVNTSNATSNTITDGTNTTEATASTITVKDNAGNSTVITKDTITTGTGTNKVTVDGTAGKVTAGSAVVDGVNNTITTGGANTVKLDGAAGTVTGLTNTAWTPGVTKAVSGRAATEDQLQQVSDAVGAGWNINSGTVAGSTGEANGSAKTKISSGEEVQLQAGNNLIIDQNGKTLAYSLNKNLKDMESVIFNATGGKTTVIKGDSIVQTDGGKTNTSNAAGNTVVDGTKSTATTAAGTTITDGAKTNTSTADKNVIDDGAGNTNTSNATSNTIADPNGNTNTATATNNTLADNAGNSNVSNATSNTLKNAAGDETKVDAKGATVKDAAGNTTNVASTGATVTNAAGDTTKVEATGTTVADATGNKSTFTKDGVTITKPGKDTVSLTGNGLDNGNNKIVNVADGTNDTDAVNVRQLDAKTKAATTELTANGGESADNTTGNIVLTKTTAPDGHIIYDNKLNDKITLGAADPTKAITVDGTNGTIKAGKDGNAVAINGTDGTIKAGDGTNAIAIDGVNGSVKVADKIALNGKDGKAAIGTVGIDGKDSIITTGGNNPVAVNGKDGVVTGLTNKTWDPNNITSGRAATEDQVQSAVANAGWDATVGTEGSGVNSTPSAAPEKIRPNETLTFKAGNNMMVSHAGKTISYAVNPELTDMKSATFKDAAGNTTVTNGNGITITPGSANPNNPNAGPVSLTKDGLNNGNNQIKGVAPGSDDTDAVNIAQLKASNANTSQAINQVAGEVQRVGAHAAAMAALKPIQYDPLEPTQIMAGVGNYRGETAAALGLAHYTNEDTMFNVGVSVGGNHNMVNAGVTHKFGSSPEKKNIPDRYKAGPISSVYVMQDEVSSLKKENAEQKYVIADQAARLNTLEAENERQRQELAETKQGLDDLRAAVDRLLAAKG